MADQPIIWALLVGIANYPVDPIPGCIRDIENVYHYLVNELGVPPDCVVVLLDEEATRQGIISTFEAHLINNPKIQKEHPILFHYSGHGTRKPAPKDWPDAWKDSEDRVPQLEMIVPFDAVHEISSHRDSLFSDGSRHGDGSESDDDSESGYETAIEDDAYFQHLSAGRRGSSSGHAPCHQNNSAVGTAWTNEADHSLTQTSSAGTSTRTTVSGRRGSPDGFVDDRNHRKRLRRERKTPGIPDRTLGALLRRAAKKHENSNITVVLDSCHSGHGTRSCGGGAYRTRGIDPAYVGDLFEDTDQEIWGHDGPSQSSYLRGAFIDRQDASHVLMAACGRREEAIGDDTGGLFTTAWLKALRNPQIQPRSYSEILKHIKHDFAAVFNSFAVSPDRPRPQNPQCEGVNRDRIIFENRAVDPGQFAVSPQSPPEFCRIEAGELLGVKTGTLFELRHFSPGKDTVLGSAVTSEVFPTHCIARVPAGVTIAPFGIRAFVTNLADPLRFSIVNSRPASEISTSNLNRLRTRLGDPAFNTGATYVEVDLSAGPDLILNVDDDGVALDRRDRLMSYLEPTGPRVHRADIDTVFPRAMGFIARFNFYLAQESPLHPFADNVDIRLHYLQQLKVTIDQEEYMGVDEEIPFVNHEAVVLHMEETLYGLVLRNNTDQALYPYIFWFDPNTYAIEKFYSPSNSTDPPLKPGRELQIGRSPECMAAMSFVVNNEQEKDTGFLKVILTTADVEIHIMQQDNILGYGSEGRPPLLEVRGTDANESARPIKGQWDTITRKVTVLPNPDNIRPK